MAKPPLLTLSDVGLGFGGDPLLDGLDLSIHAGDRLALVGRNGSGKSSLMKIMAGLIEPDRGVRFLAPGNSVGYMEQHPDMSGHATLGDFAAAGLPPGEEYRVEIVAEGVKFNPEQTPDRASGGERRRAALARIIAEEPDLMLLDEPTNHLDIEAIGWLEEHLKAMRGTFLLISHDRAFLKALTKATLWVDRGVVRRLDKGFAAFEDWRDKVFAEEDLERHKLNRLIRAESRWAVEGISARRKRNMGRVRRLHALKDARADQIARQGVARLALEQGPKGGKLVIEARGLAKSYEGRAIVRDFSIRVQRGERLALVGPNGVGKTTLVEMLIGQLAPDSGTLRLGTGLVQAIFDQNRAGLDPEASLWESLTHDPALGVSGKNDQVMVRGRPRHVVGYLRDFLFDESQARGPVRALSGGEKARLLLARLMARESNLLVLDEPTNDLDVETLDLLQEILDDYDGTVLLVSHDRDFLDRVATTTIAPDGRGNWLQYAGGWSDYQAQRGESAGTRPGAAPQGARGRGAEKPKAGKAGGKDASGNTSDTPASRQADAGLSFTEAHRLEALPEEIARLEGEIGKLEAFLGDPDLFSRAPEKFRKASDGLVERQNKLAAAEEEWLRLAEKAEG